MIDIRDNWRILMLVVLVVLAAVALFGPLGASGDNAVGGERTLPEPVSTATSVEDGRYSVELPAGEYDALVDEIGYEQFDEPVTVTADSTTELDISLTSAPTGTVSGTVTGPSGPVSDINLSLTDIQTGVVTATVRTDADGMYSTDLEPGNYSLTVDEVGYEYYTEDIQVRSEETIDQNIDLNSEETGTISGNVTAEGQPVSDVAITLIDSVTGRTAVTTTPDETGYYQVTAPAGDEVEISVSDVRFEPSTVDRVIGGGQEHTANFELTRRDTGTVTGTITEAGTGTAVPQATVNILDPEADTVVTTATTDETGVYEVELPVLEEPASFNISLDHLLYESTEQQISLEVDQTLTQNMEVDRRPTGSIEGTVTDGDGPVEGVNVQFLDPEERLGEDLDDTGVGDPTNLQYGLELSGGARIRSSLVGMTAENIQLPEDIASVESTVAEEVGVEPIDVLARPRQGTVELFTENVTRDEFASALNTAGLDVQTGDISQGVTSATIDNAVTTLRLRVDETGLSGGNVFTSTDVTGQEFIIAEVPGVTRSELRTIISDAGRVQLVAGFPEQTENGTTVLNTTEILSQDGISAVDNAQAASARQPQPHVPVTLTPDAGERFQDILVEAGFTSPSGVANACGGRLADEDGYIEGEHCLYTVVDGEVVHSSSMGRDLANTLESGQFVRNPSFIVQTGTFQEAQELEVNLESGSLPTEINIVTESFISPSLAQFFKPLALLTALIAWLAVSLVVYYWYRDVRVAIPMLLTASAEVFLLLGFAAGIGMALDLSHIAGFIAVIGTGLDDLIIMADEILQRKETVETGRIFQSRFRKAFWVIGMAAATTIIAMSPLAILSLGDLQGFAIITIVGVLIGVAVTRPAYGDVLRNLVLEDVKRK